ncbi:MAG: VCBS domain-containing protein, partial [Planctomycetales bacterium]|nr:VCBS domain-containing protein [Planctomycetales bacterium]
AEDAATEYLFVGSGSTSSLSIDPDNANSVLHVQMNAMDGYFVVDGIKLRYENVGTVVSPASAVIISSLPVEPLEYGDSLVVVATPPNSFDPNVSFVRSWTIDLDGVELEVVDGDLLSVLLDQVGTYRLTYAATQDGRMTAFVAYEFEVTNAPPVAVNDVFAGNEDSELVVSASDGLLANDSNQTAGPLRVVSVVDRSIVAAEPFAFTSAELNPAIPASTLSINDANYYGVRFEVTETLELERVGGNFQFFSGTGPFAAVVQLESSTDLPDSVDLSTPDVLASTIVPLAFQQDGDRQGDISVTLQPGWYALMFGTGKFGSTGITNMYLNNDPTLTPNDYLHARLLIPEYFPISPANPTWKARFTLEGTVARDAAIVLDSGAQLTVQPDGSFMYDPNGRFDSLAPGAIVQETFTYVVADSGGLTAEATATIEVQGVNDSPVAQDDVYVVSEQSLLSPAASVNVIVNDSDVDGSVLQLVQIDGQPFVGEIRLPSGATVMPADEPNRFVYDPRAVFDCLTTGQTATDEFTYQITDEHGATAIAIITITVNGWDDAPTANDDHYDVSEDLLLAPVAANGLLISDYDPEVTQLTLLQIDGRDFTQALTLGSGATITPGDLPNSFVYDPRFAFSYLAEGETATDSFTYQVSDA